MPSSDAELALCLHRRARRVLLELLAALNGLDARQSKAFAKLSSEAVHDALSLAILRYVVFSFGRAHGLFVDAEELASARLFEARAGGLEVQLVWSGTEASWLYPPALARAEAALERELGSGLVADGVDWRQCPAELVGNLYELLLADRIQQSPSGAFELASGNRRKSTGTFFTPRSLTEVVVARAIEARRPDAATDVLFVCDPAVGGGAFLIEAARALASSEPAARSAFVRQALVGVDINPVAVAVAEAALCLFAAEPRRPLAEFGRNLRVADALSLDFEREFPEVFAHGGFDWVVGNPPWVAYAGRAAKPLAPERKAYLAANYTTLKGYPTLHGLFVERALRLAPRGTVALVVPSPIADLQGYRAVRRAVREKHTPREPMLEFGQDAFAAVTQPCFALIAEPDPKPTQPASDEPFRLVERQRAGVTAAEVSPPDVLLALGKGPAFPRELFGEMGFQTTSRVTRELLRRAPEPSAPHDYPLLEGRDVREFAQGGPRLFLNPDRAVLAESRCRLRDSRDYERVRFVVRQTARYPIAALHRGLPFRNSLLAGFEVEGLPVDLVVGLLNSSLYRALHLALRRDARQAAFPQVKVSHLRALPEPPLRCELRSEIASLSADLSRTGPDAPRAERLDAAVFGLFSLDSSAARQVLEFLSARGALRR